MKKVFTLSAVAGLAAVLLAGGAAASAGTGDTSGPSKLPVIHADLQVSPQAGGSTVYFPPMMGCNLLTVSAPVLGGFPVAVSASETDASFNEYIGSATISVANVAVTNGQIMAQVCVNWSAPLRIAVHYVWP